MCIVDLVTARAETARTHLALARRDRPAGKRSRRSNSFAARRSGFVDHPRTGRTDVSGNAAVAAVPTRPPRATRSATVFGTRNRPASRRATRDAFAPTRARIHQVTNSPSYQFTNFLWLAKRDAFAPAGALVHQLTKSLIHQLPVSSLGCDDPVACGDVRSERIGVDRYVDPPADPAATPERREKEVPPARESFRAAGRHAKRDRWAAFDHLERAKCLAPYTKHRMVPGPCFDGFRQRQTEPPNAREDRPCKNARRVGR